MCRRSSCRHLTHQYRVQASCNLVSGRVFSVGSNSHCQVDFSISGRVARCSDVALHKKFNITSFSFMQRPHQVAAQQALVQCKFTSTVRVAGHGSDDCCSELLMGSGAFIRNMNSSPRAMVRASEHCYVAFESISTRFLHLGSALFRFRQISLWPGDGRSSPHDEEDSGFWSRALFGDAANSRQDDNVRVARYRVPLIEEFVAIGLWPVSDLN